MKPRISSAALFISLIIPALAAAELSPAPEYDVLIKGGTVYDGSGEEGRVADVAIRGDRIAGVGDFKNATAKNILDAHGLAAAPGFINMLSCSTESLIYDGHSQSEISGFAIDLSQFATSRLPNHGEFGTLEDLG